MIALIVICSCQKEEVNFDDNEKGVNYENVYNFVKKHVEINNKIIAIFDEETKFNNELFLNPYLKIAQMKMNLK